MLHRRTSGIVSSVMTRTDGSQNVGLVTTQPPDAAAS